MGQDVQSRASPDRRPSLDAYRGIACLLVFFDHSALKL